MRSLRAVQLLTIFVFFFGLVLPVVAQEKGAEGAYTIKQGDTLWDISSRFLKNPFLWPKLWQRNSYITNPHWIYPGNPIRLSAFEEIRKEEPAKVAADERPIGEKPKEEKVKEEKPKGVAPVASEPEVKREEPPQVEKKPELVSEVKRVEERPFAVDIRSAGFFSSVDYQGIGIIVESKEGKSLMAEGDIVYLLIKSSEPILIGNKYTIFRPSEPIRHPITDARLGRKYSITGNLQIIDRAGRFFTGKVIEAFQQIERGDRLQPYQKEKMEGPR